MTDVESQFSTLDKRVLKSAERQFPEVSREVCPDREGNLCRIAGESCELYDCPKLKGEKSSAEGLAKAARR